MCVLRSLLLVLALPCSAASGQSKGRNIVYIQKDSLLGHKQSIYYDMDSNSRGYKLISDFRFKDFDKESYDNSLRYLAEKKILLRKRTPIIPITRWVTLKQYKGAFYAYCPCDLYAHFRISINDTTFINWTGEGPEATKISDQKKVDDSTYTFRLSGMYGRNEYMTIYVIDTAKGVAVFERSHNGGDDRWLMIAADKIRTVPLIMNNCEAHKQMELRFETPDHKKLIRNWPKCK